MMRTRKLAKIVDKRLAAVTKERRQFPNWSLPEYDNRKSELAGEIAALTWVRGLLTDAKRT